MNIKCLLPPNFWCSFVVFVGVLTSLIKLVKSLLPLVAIDAFPWMLYGMSTVTYWEKIKAAWIPL